MKTLVTWIAGTTLNALASASFAAAIVEGGPVNETAAGAELSQSNCIHCHNGSVPKAPHAISFNMMSTGSIVSAITEGVMRQQAAHLSQEERVQIAQYLSGAVDSVAHEVKACGTDFMPVLAATSPPWNGWGGGIRNQRFQEAESAGINLNTVDQVELKWAFAYPGISKGPFEL